jgi:hypothetical protein
MGRDIKEFKAGSLVADDSRVLVANGVVVLAQGKGQVEIQIDGASPLVIEALYVPDLTHNLISVRYLQTHQISTLFFSVKLITWPVN